MGHGAAGAIQAAQVGDFLRQGEPSADAPQRGHHGRGHLGAGVHRRFVVHSSKVLKMMHRRRLFFFHS
jgi:hypothetical protein